MLAAGLTLRHYKSFRVLPDLAGTAAIASPRNRPGSIVMGFM